ncbi:MAG: hypothetical protein QNJ97_23000 [Myxococcota bacterium]|nr:hypothetical protein [Myxococcota bacterium]
MRFSLYFGGLFSCFGMLSIIYLGCGAGSPEAGVHSANLPPAATEEKASHHTQTGEVDGLLATVPQGEVDAVFSKNMDGLHDCYNQVIEDLEEIAGTVAFAIQVGQGNRVVEVYIRDSDLGSLDAEMCMLRCIQGFTFERQGSGIAHVSKRLVFEAPYDHPDPLVWEGPRVQKVVRQHRANVKQCLGQTKGVHVTLYVGKGGMVLSAGAASDDVAQKEAGACLAQAVLNWTFPDPDPNLAKVHLSF